MKRTMKLVSILLIAVIMIANMSTLCLATATAGVAPGDIVPDYSGINTTGVQNTAKKVMGLIRNIAVIAGVLLIAVLGVKYMLGSVEEKAEYKKSFMPLIVGAVVVMAATQIATMIFSLAS